MKSYREPFSKYIRELQNSICSEVERVDGKAKFEEDQWIRPEGGGGYTRIIKDGNVIEKGGVNISMVEGHLPASMQTYLGVEHSAFFACGLSLVLHPFNPFVPTVHANYRYFEVYDNDGLVIDQWFGGGADLTPYYLFEEDAIHFHQTLKDVCVPFGEELYPTYKLACDQYFRNHHRNEGRGIGGLFFDHLKGEVDGNIDYWYDFVTSAGRAFNTAYIPIMEKRKNLAFNDDQKYWQQIRRGRYVEFNLIHDKGTLFGLKTSGRIESILMSLPATVRWDYQFEVPQDSEEQRLVEVLINPKDWVNLR